MGARRGRGMANHLYYGDNLSVLRYAVVETTTCSFEIDSMLRNTGQRLLAV
jgi:hypothetical protein